MTLRHLKIFYTLCINNYNMTKAAESLYMAQPAISLAIKEIENYYNIKLFDRLNRRLSITKVGEVFLEYTKRILSQFNDMEKEMYDFDSAGLIKVGASITIGSQFLPYYVKAFNHQKPNTQVKVEVAPYDILEKDILDNRLDIALIEGEVHNPNIYHEEYMDDYLCVIASSEYKDRRHISLEDFKKQDFLLREVGSGTRDFFDSKIKSLGFTIEPIWEAMSTTALVNAVINGLGISVLPYRMIQGPLKRGQIVTLMIDELDFRRSFSIMYHKDKYLTNAAKIFIDICKNYALDYPLPKYEDLY